MAVSEATRRDVHDALGIPADRIRLAYNAPNPDFFRPTARRPRPRRPGALPDRLSFPALCRQHPPAEEHSAPGGSLRGGSRAAVAPPGVPRPAPDHHRRRDFALSFRTPRGHPDARGKGGALSRLRALRGPAHLLRERRAVRLPFALRRLRPAAARSHGHGHAGGGLERQLHCRKCLAMPPCW